MGNNKFCPSCKYFEKTPDNCGRKNGKYGLCVRQMKFGLKPMVHGYQVVAKSRTALHAQTVECRFVTARQNPKHFQA